MRNTALTIIPSNFNGLTMIENYFRQHDYKLDRTKLLTDNRAAGNSTLAIGGVSSPLDSFVVAER